MRWVEIGTNTTGVILDSVRMGGTLVSVRDEVVLGKFVAYKQDRIDREGAQDGGA